MEMLPDEVSDTALMLDLAGGRDAALSALIHRWQSKIISYLTRLVTDPETARDLAQETFVRVYRHRQRYDAQQSFSTWLFSIATNLSRNHHRWRQRHPEAPLEPEQMQQIEGAPRPLHPDQILAQKEIATAVQAGVTKLPEDQRTALILSYYEGLPQKEIAEIMQCSVKGVELKIYRARQTLREALAVWL
jgi:RNA polymerase sigma-70 factor (ECF subfamily)